MNNAERRARALEDQRYAKRVLCPLGICLVVVSLLLFLSAASMIDYWRPSAFVLAGELGIHPDHFVVPAIVLPFMILAMLLFGILLAGFSSEPRTYQSVPEIYAIHKSWEEVFDGSVVTVIETIDGPVVRLSGRRKIEAGNRLSCTHVVRAEDEEQLHMFTEVLS